MKIKTIFTNLLNSSQKELYGHSMNYLIAEFFNKALIFIFLPIITRIMTPSEYGVISLYTSAVIVLELFLELGFHTVVARYYYEKTDDFQEFLGTNLIFLLIFSLIISCILFLFKDSVALFFGLSNDIFLLAVASSLLTVFVSVFLSYLRACQLSKRFAVISIVRNSAILVVSTFLMMTVNYDKPLIRIYTQIIVTIIVSLVAVLGLVNIARFKFSFKHISYALVIGLPLVPFDLSNYLLNQFDRVQINQLNGINDTGIYSFAYNISLIVYVVIMGMNNAWAPIFFRGMNLREYKQIDSLVKNNTKILSLLVSAFVLFSRLLVLIMSDTRYHDAISITPIIIIGHVFFYIFSIYARYSMYYKKTIIIAIITVFCCAVKILLNYVLIPIWGYKVAGFTTLVIYFFLALLNYLNVRFFLKTDSYISMNIILIPLSIIIPSVAVFYIEYFTQLPDLFCYVVNFIVLTGMFFVIGGIRIFRKAIIRT